MKKSIFTLVMVLIFSATVAQADKIERKRVVFSAGVDIENADKGDYKIDGTPLNATAAELNVLDQGNWSVSTTALSTVSIATSLSDPQLMTITLDDFAIVFTNSVAGEAVTAGAKILDFAEGLVDVKNVMLTSFAIASNAVLTNANAGDVSMGTAIATGVSLAGTEVDLYAADSVDPITNATVTGFLASGAKFDGTSSAIDMNMNVLLDGDTIGGAVTILVDAVSIVDFNIPGDY